MEELLSTTENPNFYKNIENSIFFSTMDYKPISSYTMYKFIKIHNGHNFIDKNHIKKICLYGDMTTIQLDTLFILTRYMMSLYTKIIKNMVIECKKSAILFKNAPKELIKIIQNTNFAKNLSYNTINNLDNDISFDKFIKAVSDSLELMINTQSYFDQNNNIDLSNLLNDNVKRYFIENSDILENYVKIIYEKFKKIIDNKSHKIKVIIDLCGKEIDSSDNMILNNFIKSHLQIVPNYINDRILKKYYKFMEFFYQYDKYITYEKDFMSNTSDYENNLMFNTSNYDKIYDDFDDINDYSCFYPNDQKNTYHENESSYKNIRENINIKLNKIGFQIDSSQENLLNNSLLDCFVQRGFVNNSKEIISLICNILLTERDTIGYLNKYEKMSLIEYFNLIAIANDITISYDNFVQNMIGTTNIPINYPLEIIMRILSRVYNIKITFFTNQLLPLIIDNYLYENFNCIYIYQYSSISYLNIVPLESNISKNILTKNDRSDINTNQNQNEPINNIIDIVDI